VTSKRPSPRRASGFRQVHILWSNRALSDLESIGKFIARDNVAAAERWVLDLVQADENLSSFPLLGRRVREIHREDTRELIHRRYRIVYRITPSRLEILTVFEGHRRLPDDLG